MVRPKHCDSHIAKEGGKLIRKTNIPVQELQLKMGGGLYMYTRGAYLWDTMVIFKLTIKESRTAILFRTMDRASQILTSHAYARGKVIGQPCLLIAPSTE